MGSAQVQGRLWGVRADDWADNEAMCTPFYDALFDAASVGPGTRLLDLGCGAGTALVRAAARGATVTGVDASAGMIAYARDQLPGADLREADLESLPYPDGAFDVVTAFNSIGFAADPVAALREAKRVTAPGGRVGVVVWGDPERCDMRALLAALGALHPARAEAPPAPTIDVAMAAAGLPPKETGEVGTPLVYLDLAAAVRIQSSSGPAQLAIESAGEAATRDAIATAFADSRRPDGSYRMDNVFRWLVAAA
jgi:SAM-dependent methyltransferase